VLLGFYPHAERGEWRRLQLPAPIVVETQSDTGVTRLQHQFRNGREQLQGVVSYTRNTNRSANLFSLVDQTQNTNTNLDINIRTASTSSCSCGRAISSFARPTT
jgi:hypothetical protein